MKSNTAFVITQEVKVQCLGPVRGVAKDLVLLGFSIFLYFVKLEKKMKIMMEKKNVYFLTSMAYFSMLMVLKATSLTHSLCKIKKVI